MGLSENIINKMEKIRSHFPTTQALTIPLLIEIQNEQGFVSESAMRDAAQFLGLPLSKVKEVATFYTMFNLKPIGKVHLQLCMNLSCWLNGSEKLLHCLEKRLGIGCGQTSQDGKYTLGEVECLASCGTAPVLQVNEDYYENLNEQKLNALLDQIEGRLEKGEQNIGRSTNRGVWP